MTGFSSEWENCYSNNTQLSSWPWSDVVSLVHRFCRPLLTSRDRAGKVLEMGCGAGANIPFFRELGFDYKAIEGSQTIVEVLHRRFPDLIDNIICGDYTSVNPFNEHFDLVLDRASLTHNNSKSIEKTLNIVYHSLKEDGLFIGVDWFSMKHTDVAFGVPVDDDFTRISFPHGQFEGVGKVHFSDENHIRGLFRKFEILFLEEKIINRYEPQDNHQFAAWNVVVRKGSV